MREHLLKKLLVPVALIFSAAVMIAGIAPSGAAQTQTGTQQNPPDLSGVYYVRDFRTSFLPKGSQPPFQPATQAAYEAREHHEKANTDPTDVEDPTTSQCIPPGIPRILFNPFPFEIVQSKDRVIMLFEFNRQVREIYLNRQEHPKDLQPTYMGDSIGSYDGDTLVVDTVGFKPQTWLDADGLPHSDALHLTERIRRSDPKTLEIKFTIDDPKAYTSTWTATKLYGFKPGWEIQEYVCEENNRFMNSTATPH